MNSTKFKNIEAIIFDNDGTITFNSEILHYQTNKWVFAEYYKLSEREYVQRWMIDGTGSQGLIRDLGLNIDYEKFKREKKEYYEQRCKDNLVLNPGVLDLIDTVKKHFPLAIASASHRYEIITALDVCGIKDRFKFLIGVEDVENFKPAPDCYLKAAEKLGVNQKKCLVFEDNERGLKAAKAAGMYCIINPNKFIAEYIKEDYSKADLIINSFTDLDYSLFLPIISS